MKELTQRRLKEMLYYDKETGLFTWLISISSNVESGDIAGSINSDGYIAIGIDNKNYKAHRLAWFYVEGYWPEADIDHKDRVRDNNIWTNLRHVSRLCNIRNRGITDRNKSGVIGVFFNKTRNKWVASIKVNDKSIHLGISTDFTKMVSARWHAEVKYGLPNCNTTSTAYNYLNDNNLI